MTYGQVHDLQNKIVKLMAIEDEDYPDLEKRLSSARRLLNNTAANLVRFEADLGLNPTARTRIRLDKAEPRTRKEKLLG